MVYEDEATREVVVIDLGSPHGTILERNSEKGRIGNKTILQDGDYLIIGSTRLHVRLINPEGSSSEN